MTRSLTRGFRIFYIVLILQTQLILLISFSAAVISFCCEAQQGRESCLDNQREKPKNKFKKSFRGLRFPFPIPLSSHSSKRWSESPSQKASPELSKVNKLTNKIKQRESRDYPFQSTNICLIDVCVHESYSMWLLPGHIPEVSTPCVSASLWMLPTRLGLRLQLPSPGSSITHVNTRQWLAPSVWDELWALCWSCQTGREGSALSTSPLSGLMISSGLFCGSWPLAPLLEHDATFHESDTVHSLEPGCGLFCLEDFCVAQKCFHKWPKC